MKIIQILLTFCTIAFLTIACQNNEVYSPKPRAYYRIAINDTTYQTLENKFPYCFEYSSHAFIDPYQLHDNSSKYWINIVYPQLNAIVYISYLNFNNDSLLNVMINDSRTMVFKQIKKADDIIESHIIDDSNAVYGKIYEVIGNEAACPLQIWITDKKQHFFRASMYFGCKPNNDSLQPAIDFLKKDMFHLVETFHWN